jgi:hypothetical protein
MEEGTVSRATKEEVRARYHAHHDHARSTLGEAAWLAIQSTALVYVAYVAANPWAKAGAIAGAVLVVIVAWGLWRATDWGRIGGAIVSLLVGSAGLIVHFVTTSPGDSVFTRRFLFPLLTLGTAVYLLSPSTKATFRAAREARARAAIRKG